MTPAPAQSHVVAQPHARLRRVIPPEFKHELLSRTDIIEVIGRRMTLKKAGTLHKGLCPFHGEKTPSFTVSPVRQTYHCFGCGVHGNAIDFIMENEGMNFVEALKALASEVGMEVPEDQRSQADRDKAVAEVQRQQSLTSVLAKAETYYRQQLKAAPHAVDYLKGRGLSGQVAAQFGLGYAPAGWRNLAGVFPDYRDAMLVDSGLVILQGEQDDEKRYDRFRDRIMFPIRNVRGDVIGFGGRVLDASLPKYLNSPETPVFHKGHELYGLFEARTAIRKAGHVLVVEGYMDVVALAQLGFEQSVATLGTACTAEHVQKLFRFTNTIVFSFDGDAAGRRAAQRALEAVLPQLNESRKAKFLFLPTEHDPDSFVRDFGTDAFQQCIDAAMPLSRWLIDCASQGADLQSVEGRAQLIDQARPWVQAMPQGALRTQLQAEVARVAQMSSADLLQLWESVPGRRPSAPQQAPARTASAPSPSPQRGGGLTPDMPWDMDVPLAEPDMGHDPGLDDYPADAGVPAAGQDSRPARQGGQGGKQGFAPRRQDAGKGRRFPRWGEPQPEAWNAPIGAEWLNQMPVGAADNVVRLLMLHSGWWDQLTPEDQDLLHELPEPHATYIRWLEQQVHEFGGQPWAAVQASVQTEAFSADIQRLVGDVPIDDATVWHDLRRAMDQLILGRLREQAKQVLTHAERDIEALKAYQAIQARILALRKSLEAKST